MCFFSARWREGCRSARQHRHVWRHARGEDAPRVLCAAAAVGHLICARTIRGGLFQRPLARRAGRAIGLAVLADNSAPAGAKGSECAASSACMAACTGGGRAARAFRCGGGRRFDMRPNHRLRRILFQRPLARRAGRAIGLTVLADNSAPAGAKGPEGGIIGVYGGVRGGGRAARALRAAAVGRLICARTIGCGAVFFNARWREGAGGRRQHRRVWRRARGRTRRACFAGGGRPARRLCFGRTHTICFPGLSDHCVASSDIPARRELSAASPCAPRVLSAASPCARVRIHCAVLSLPAAGSVCRVALRPPVFSCAPREGRILAGIQRPPVRVLRAA